MLAKSNADLKEHLISGPKNAKCVSKTIQNKILDIAADNKREYYRKCLRKSSHFSIIADEVTSHGKGILAVWLRFLDIHLEDFQTKPQKREAVLDFQQNSFIFFQPMIVLELSYNVGNATVKTFHKINH